MATDLQRLHTQRRDILDAMGRRVPTGGRLRPAEWLFSGLRAPDEFALDLPEHLGPAERRTRSRDRYNGEVARREDVVGAALGPGIRLAATLSNGEMAFLADGVPIVDRVFVTIAEGPFLHAQWCRVAATFAVTERTTGKDLCDELRRVAPTANSAIMEQVVALAAELVARDDAIAEAEAAMQRLTFDLYDLSDAERTMVLRG